MPFLLMNYSLPSMTLEINSPCSYDNKKIRISASSHHLAGYYKKHVCFKQISKEFLGVLNLREDEKGHSVACIVRGGCYEGI